MFAGLQNDWTHFVQANEIEEILSAVVLLISSRALGVFDLYMR